MTVTGLAQKITDSPLVDLPKPILARAADRETLPNMFAEKLARRLKDSSFSISAAALKCLTSPMIILPM